MAQTLQDMEMIYDLSIDETHVTSCGGSINRDMLCDCLLGRVPPSNAHRGDCIKLTWLDANFQTPQ
jgi:hypothetical protein